MESAQASVAPNNSSSGGKAILAVAILTTIIAVCCMVLRSYIRLRITKSFWWDDGIIVFATVLSVVGLAFNILGVKEGAGQHEFLLQDPEIQVPKIIMWNTAYQLDNVISVNMIKVSILLFIMRMHNSRTLAYIIWAVMVVMSLVNMITVAALAAQCRPLRKLWIPTTHGTCYHKGELSGFGYGQGVVNILTDFFCTILPIVIMWKVRMPLRTKLVVWGLMSLGLMATASQIVRVILLDTLEAKDYSHDILGIVISAVLDQNLGITAACIPTLRPVLRLFKNGSKSNASSGSIPINSIVTYGRSGKKPKRGFGAKYGQRDLTTTNSTIEPGRTVARSSNDSDVPLQDLEVGKGEGSVLGRRYEVEVVG